MPTDKEKLLPCPFCGGEPKVVTKDVEPQQDSWYGSKDETFIECRKCGCCMFDEYFHTGFWLDNNKELCESGVEAWNTRATTNKV